MDTDISFVPVNSSYVNTTCRPHMSVYSGSKPWRLYCLMFDLRNRHAAPHCGHRSRAVVNSLRFFYNERALVDCVVVDAAIFFRAIKRQGRFRR